MISFEEEIQKIRAARKIPKDSDKNPLKKLENLPILVNQGTKDTVVGNPWAYETFRHIPGKNKHLFTIDGQDHIPFGHGKHKEIAKDYVSKFFSDNGKK